MLFVINACMVIFHVYYRKKYYSIIYTNMLYSYSVNSFKIIFLLQPGMFKCIILYNIHNLYYY